MNEPATDSMPRLPLYILAGGKSRRFGSDKARAEWGGQPLIRRLAEQLAPVAARTTVVADVAGKYADLGLTTIADREPGQGPLGGLATALVDLRAHGGSGWLLLSSCDLVEAKPAWVAQLWAAANSSETPAAGAVAFRGRGGGADERWEPLFGLYHVSAEPAVSEQLAAGQRAMRQLLERLDAVALSLPADWPAVAQVNTPQEFEQARGQGVIAPDSEGAADKLSCQ